MGIPDGRPLPRLVTRPTLFTRHRGIALGEARDWTIPGLDADDVRQEALVALWEATGVYDPERGTFPALARTVVRRHLIDLLEAATRLKRTAELDRDADPADVRDRIAARLELVDLARANLTETERAAVLRQGVRRVHAGPVAVRAWAGRPDDRGRPFRVPGDGRRVRYLVTALIALTLTTAALAAPKPDPPMRAIHQAREQTHRCERQLGLDPTPVSKRPVGGIAYRQWVLALWKGRADAACRLARELGHPVAAIRAVFGPDHADEALTVARCESGLSTRARNGQYLGTFQMGDYARSRYGHGDSALEQARAAHAYWEDAGWSPWQCSPGGGLAW